MAMRTGKVIIAKNIKLNKSYKDVLDYTEQEMLNLVNSKKVAETSSASFIRVGDNVIDTDFTYNDALKCNYIALQNPSYSNKWFFGFIDSVEYISNGNARIHYTIDEHSTWFDYWTSKACFVIREHVNNDSFGLHTVPEDLETGEYISCNLQPSGKDYGDTCFCVATTEQRFTSYSTLNELLPSGVYYSGFTTLQGVQDFLKRIDEDGKSDIVNSVFVCPKLFFTAWSTSSGIDGQVSTDVRFTLNTIDIEVTHVDYLGNNYVPKNNKLKCFPYSYLQVSNHSGTIVNYNWEDFNLLDIASDNKIHFSLGCALSPGCSGYAHPINYKNILNNYDDGITFGKFPVGGWNTDTYTNWLTQNGVNNSIGIVGGIITTGLGIAGAFATGGISLALAGAVIGGGVSIASSLNSRYQHSLAPDQAKGNTNVGDYNFSNGWLELEFKRMSIKNEYCKIIDDYFTRFGYKVNTIKIPNKTGRHYWNYVQIGAEEDIGYSTNTERSVPASSMEIINNIYRIGVSIWHDHDQLGNYNLNNNIL